MIILYHVILVNTNDTDTSNTGRARIHRASGIAGDAQHWMLRLGQARDSPFLLLLSSHSPPLLNLTLCFCVLCVYGRRCPWLFDTFPVSGYQLATPSFILPLIPLPLPLPFCMGDRHSHRSAHPTFLQDFDRYPRAESTHFE